MSLETAIFLIILWFFGVVPLTYATGRSLWEQRRRERTALDELALRRAGPSAGTSLADRDRSGGGIVDGG